MYTQVPNSAQRKELVSVWCGSQPVNHRVRDRGAQQSTRYTQGKFGLVKAIQQLNCNAELDTYRVSFDWDGGDGRGDDGNNGGDGGDNDGDSHGDSEDLFLLALLPHANENPTTVAEDDEFEEYEEYEDSDEDDDDDDEDDEDELDSTKNQKDSTPLGDASRKGKKPKNKDNFICESVLATNLPTGPGIPTKVS